MIAGGYGTGIRASLEKDIVVVSWKKIKEGFVEKSGGDVGQAVVYNGVGAGRQSRAKVG